MATLSLDAVRRATAQVRKEAAEIVELCAAAGKPASTAAEFIRQGLTPESARRRLEGVAPPAKRPGRQQPSAGNGAGFDLAMIERAIAEKRTLQ